MPKENPHRADMILRDKLALDRTHLANERTLLSYQRTGLYIIAFATAILKLEYFERLRTVGLMSVALAAFIMVLGIVRFFRAKRRIESYYVEEGD